jgi:hypothetical protein
MRISHQGFAIAGLAALTAFGATAFAGDAEAGGKHKHKRHGLTVIIGDGGYGYRSRGYSTRFRSAGYGCGYLLDRYEMTGNPKWYSRWKRCRNGW